MTMRTCIPALAILFLALCAGSANAASFNCHQSLPADMRVICNDPGLNGRDTEAGMLYDQLSHRLSYTGRAALREERLGFLRERGQCGVDRRCMARVYDDQIQRLHSMFPPR